MTIEPIRDESDLHTALNAISNLMDSNPAPGTPESEQLDALVTLVEAYEAIHHPISPPDPLGEPRYSGDTSEGEQ